MNIKLINNGFEGVLLLEGRLDSNTSMDLEPILMETTERFERLVLDMGAMSYLSSAGLRIVKKAFVAMQKKDGELVLTNVPQPIMEVFEITKFISFLKFE